MDQQILHYLLRMPQASNVSVLIAAAVLSTMPLKLA